VSPWVCLLLGVLTPHLVHGLQEPQRPQKQQRPQQPQEPQHPPQRVQPLPIPSTVVLKLEKGRRIVVDGALTEWPETVLPFAIDLVDTRRVSGSWMGAYNKELRQKDISGRVFLTWDAERLYIGAKVLDDWHRALGKKGARLSEIPPADNLIVTLDPDRNTRSLGPDEGRTEDQEFWLADVAGQGRRLVRWDRYRGTAGYVEGALFVLDRSNEAGVTTYEASIPWQAILPPGRKAESGLVMGAQFVLNDYDEPTDPMPQTRVGWTFGMGPVIDPGIFGTLMLVDRLDRGAPPAIPKASPVTGDPVPGPAYWVQFQKRLLELPPAWVTPATVDAATAGGMDRLKLLRELEHHLSLFPRVDFLEFQQRINRRMVRETAGIAQTGLPFFWHHVIKDLRRRLPPEPPVGHIRVFRLPQGGWYVRSAQANFAIDPAGYQVAPYIGPAIDFVLLTRPLELTKRNDRLLVEMASRKKLIFAHLPYHLPGVDAAKMALVMPGRHYHFGELALPGNSKSKGTGDGDRKPQTVPTITILVLGRKTAEGLSAPSVGYQIKWRDGSTLLHPGVCLDPSDVRSVAGPDVLLLSALHPQALALGKQIAARHTILDEVLEVASARGPQGRATLTEAIELQQGLRPLRSIILAPGESVDIRKQTGKREK